MSQYLRSLIVLLVSFSFFSSGVAFANPAEDPTTETPTTTQPAQPPIETTPEAPAPKTPAEGAATEEVTPAQAPDPTSTVPVMRAPLGGEVVTDGPVQIVVKREYTGTGHGITRQQCGLNSKNTDIFPDGNTKGLPTDDSADDDYFCHGDSAGYSVEFNFGSTTLTEPYSTKFTWSLLDQKGIIGVDGENIQFPMNMGSFCAPSSNGPVSGKLTRNNYSVTCELTFQSGVSGVVKLPTVAFQARSEGVTSLSTTLAHKFVLGTTPVPVQPSYVLSTPLIDYRQEKPKPGKAMVVDGVVGIFFEMPESRMQGVFPSPWSTVKGRYSYPRLGTPNYQFWQIDPAQDAWQSTGTIEGAKFVVNQPMADAKPTATDADGNPIPIVVSSQAGTGPVALNYQSGGLWVPIQTIVDSGDRVDFGYRDDRLGTTSILTSPYHSNYYPNYLPDHGDPGFGEPCGVGPDPADLKDGVMTPNDNCGTQHWYLGAYNWGVGNKLVNGKDPRSTPSSTITFSPETKVTANLVLGEYVLPGSGELSMCDAWDAPGQTAPRVLAVQRFDPSRDVVVTATVMGKKIQVPATDYRIQYRESGIKMATTDWGARCADTAVAWQDSFEAAGGAEKLNNLKVLIDRKKLQQLAEANGLVDAAGYTPAVTVDLPFTAPKVTELAPSYPNPVNVYNFFSAQADTADPNVPIKYIKDAYYYVSGPTADHQVYKYVKAGALDETASIWSTNETVAPGGTVTFRVRESITVDKANPEDLTKAAVTLTDDLPGCAVNEMPKVVGKYPGMTYEFIPATGDPCNGTGTPARVIWKRTVDRTGATTEFNIFYQVKIQDVAKANTSSVPNVKSVVAFPEQPSLQLFTRNAAPILRIASMPAEMAVAKAVDADLVRTGQRVGWTLTYQNNQNGASGQAEWIDILPANGDSREGTLQTSSVGSSIGEGLGALSDLQLDSPVWSSLSASIDVGNPEVRLYVTAQPITQLSDDPAHASNKAGGSTKWCEVATGVCGDVLAKATALKVVFPKFPGYGKMKLHFTVSTDQVRHGSILVNNVGLGRVAGFTLPVPKVPPVITRVYDLLWDGIVYYDRNANAVFDGRDRLLPDVDVVLFNADGEKVLETKTDAKGYYFFGTGMGDPDFNLHPAQDPTPALVDGVYTAKVLRRGVILDVWQFTLSGGNVELNGTSADGKLGRIRDRSRSGLPDDIPYYHRADFGLVEPTGSVVWKKSDSVTGEAVGGAVFAVTLPDGLVVDVLDSVTVEQAGVAGVVDRDSRPGYFRLDGLAFGEYSVVEKSAPVGYVLSDVVGKVTVGVPCAEAACAVELADFVNELIPPNESPSPSPSATSKIPQTGADYGLAPIAVLALLFGGLLVGTARRRK